MPREVDMLRSAPARSRALYLVLLAGALSPACSDETASKDADRGGVVDLGGAPRADGDTGGRDDAAAPLADGASATDGAASPGDLARGPCKPDPMTDLQPCAAGCPTGTVAVNNASGCRCYTSCAATPFGCPCGRSCRPLYTQSDMGLVPNGSAACIPVNGAAERCGYDNTTKPVYGAGTCGEEGNRNFDDLLPDGHCYAPSLHAGTA